MSLLMYNKSVGNIIALNITFISFISLYHSKSLRGKEICLKEKKLFGSQVNKNAVVCTRNYSCFTNRTVPEVLGECKQNRNI